MICIFQEAWEKRGDGGIFPDHITALLDHPKTQNLIKFLDGRWGVGGRSVSHLVCVFCGGGDDSLGCL